MSIYTTIKKLGFKGSKDDSSYYVLSGNENIAVYSVHKGLWSIVIRGKSLDNYFLFKRIPAAKLETFLKNNIKDLKKFDKKPDASLAKKLGKEAKSMVQPLRFKNIWSNNFNYYPKFASKGILHSVDRNANIELNKKVDNVVKPLLKNDKLKIIHNEDFIRFYVPINEKVAKESLSIPYINKYYKQR